MRCSKAPELKRRLLLGTEGFHGVAQDEGDEGRQGIEYSND
jgi:hypothetical protein